METVYVKIDKSNNVKMSCEEFLDVISKALIEMKVNKRELAIRFVTVETAQAPNSMEIGEQQFHATVVNKE